MSIVLNPPVTTEEAPEEVVEEDPILTILEETEKLISDPTRWCQGHLATTAEGELALPGEEEAVRFCLTGAMYEVADFRTELGSRIALRAQSAFSRATGIVRIAEFNDTHTHAEVIAALRGVIKSYKRSKEQGTLP